tara:strand:+ start:862 stop:4461 length:3600 start_codon:yes stop_codon:yes gene_type:complete
MKKIPFCHLHVHSSYSLLDSTIKIKELISTAKKMEMEHVALTDHAVLFGAVEFYNEAISSGIKPIIGCDVYVAKHGIEHRKTQRDNMSLVLLAENQIGYENLVKLVSKAHLEGMYYKPRIDKSILKSYSEGLIALSGDLHGEVNAACREDNLEEAERLIDEYISIFGKDNFFLELTDHGTKNNDDYTTDEKWVKISQDQKKVNQHLCNLSKKMSVQLVVTNDVHYILKEHAEAHDILTCLQRGMLVADPNRYRYLGNQLYFKTGKEMLEQFPDYKEAIENTVKIAERCNVAFSLSSAENPKKAEDLHFPTFPIPVNYKSNTDYLIFLAKKGIKDLYGIEDIDNPTNDKEEEIKNRFYYEISVLEETNYINYFLVVADFIHFSRKNKIPVGPGRGSGAGSLLAYSLYITTIDPLEYSLIFERFLNPDRISPPDFDIDFCPTRRNEVIRYVRQKYGEECVAQIITFGTLGAKTLIRDVGRVLEISLSYCDKLAKMIPETPGTTIEKAFAENPEFRKEADTDPNAKRILQHAKLLEGLPRHTGMHAAGVVIGERPLIEIIPLTREQKEDLTVVQFDKDASEAIGLLKMDFLGLKNLTVIYEACALIKRNHKVTIDPEKLPLNDKKVFDLMANGDTIGVFQCESSGMRETLRQVTPDCIQDVIAVIALYRPGPMKFISTFAQRKHGNEDVKYDHLILESILKETYGIIVYQEQIMQAAQMLAGFTLAQGDILRRAIGKKKAAALAAQREAFIRGCEETNGIQKKLAAKIFDNIEEFAQYGFNKSHSAAYAMIAYQTAWLKAHYKGEFMASLLSSEMNNTDKLSNIISDTKEMNLDVLPPCINESISRFNAVGDGAIRFGMTAIKGVGEGLAEEIVLDRDANGPFNGLIDFCIRMKSPNRKMLESLVRSGAFDFTRINRSRLFCGIDMALSRATEKAKDKASGQKTFFDLDIHENNSQNEDLDLPDTKKWDEIKKLNDEKELLGFYVSGHPLKLFNWIVNKFSTHEYSDIDHLNKDELIRLGGIITDVKKLYTKNNRAMAQFKIETLNGISQSVMFPDAYEDYGKLVDDEEILMIGGKILEEAGGEKKIQVLELCPIQKAPSVFGKKIFISVDENIVSNSMLDDVKSILKMFSGKVPVFFEVLCDSGEKVLLETENICADPSVEFINEIEKIVGKKHIQIDVSESPLKNPIKRKKWKKNSNYGY